MCILHHHPKLPQFLNNGLPQRPSQIYGPYSYFPPSLVWPFRLCWQARVAVSLDALQTVLTSWVAVSLDVTSDCADKLSCCKSESGMSFRLHEPSCYKSYFKLLQVWYVPSDCLTQLKLLQDSTELSWQAKSQAETSCKSGMSLQTM